MSTTGFILLTPYAAPRRVSRDTFVNHRPALARCAPEHWLEAVRAAVGAERAMELSRTLATIRARA